VRTRTKKSSPPKNMTTNSNLPRVSVVIPTHNPRKDYLARVIDALSVQTLSKDLWELVIVDNGSKQPLAAVASEKVGMCESGKAEGPLPSHLSTCSPFTKLDLSWHPNARVVREEKLGLTFARLRGFSEAKGDLIVMVDDDNLLAPDYLANAVEIASKHPDIGAFGGKCLPEFETEPEPWMREFLPLLALRDHGEEEIVSGDIRSPDGARRAYPDKAAPIGAGMVLRSSAAQAYAERLLRSSGLRVAGGGSAYAQIGSGLTRTVITDRKGDSLASAGDNDLVFTILRDGWKVGYFPNLVVTHLIPKSRLTMDYLARANRGVQRSWVEVLRRHEACPWGEIARWSLPARKGRAFLTQRGWRKPDGFIRWQGACGQFEGRGKLCK
jgi:glycosyltransferase involved in cell wall biosynthesis